MWEEREVVCILARLGDIEPGENWIDESYNDIPGWELPMSWVHGKVPVSGFVKTTYYSGPGGTWSRMEGRNELAKQTLSGKPCTQWKKNPGQSTLNSLKKQGSKMKSLHGQTERQVVQNKVNEMLRQDSIKRQFSKRKLKLN